MKRFIKALLIVAVLLAIGVWWFRQSVRDEQPQAVSGEEAPGTTATTTIKEELVQNEGLSGTVLLEADQVGYMTGQDPVQPAQTGAASGAIPLAESPVAKQWMEAEGITADDISVALGRMRSAGYPDRMLDDPGLVRQFLPRRNVVAVNIHRLEIPGRARAGEPVPFTVSGALPDPSFQFRRFEITQQADRIRIRPIGDTTGEIAPGVEVPVKLEGELPPLSPGIYHIEFPEAGPHGAYELIVE